VVVCFKENSLQYAAKHIVLAPVFMLNFPSSRLKLISPSVPLRFVYTRSCELYYFISISRYSVLLSQYLYCALHYIRSFGPKII